jgi:hypothetical protein
MDHFFLFCKLCFDKNAPLWMLSTVVCLTFSAESISASQEPLEIHLTQTRAIATAQQTQRNEDRWASEKTTLAKRLETLEETRQRLMREKGLLSSRIDRIRQHRAETQRRIIEAAEVSEALEAYLEATVEKLNASISEDLPFLLPERNDRIHRIRDDLRRSDVSIAEKCRRVMEALRVETEYGQSVEVYQAPIAIENNKGNGNTLVDILRIGRLALFWRTPDGATTGHWDRGDGQWRILPKRYRRDINDAMEMALRQRTIDLVALPIGRITAP